MSSTPGKATQAAIFNQRWWKPADKRGLSGRVRCAQGALTGTRLHLGDNKLDNASHLVKHSRPFKRSRKNKKGKRNDRG